MAARLHTLEQLPQGAVVDPPVLVGTLHGVGLPRPCMPTSCIAPLHDNNNDLQVCQPMLAPLHMPAVSTWLCTTCPAPQSIVTAAWALKWQDTMCLAQLVAFVRNPARSICACVAASGHVIHIGNQQRTGHSTYNSCRCHRTGSSALTSTAGSNLFGHRQRCRRCSHLSRCSLLAPHQQRHTSGCCLPRTLHRSCSCCSWPWMPLCHHAQPCSDRRSALCMQAGIDAASALASVGVLSTLTVSTVLLSGVL